MFASVPVTAASGGCPTVHAYRAPFGTYRFVDCSRAGTANVAFTKWAVSLPADPATLAGVHLAGVVRGDVGRGRFSGLILDDATVTRPEVWLGHARYAFHGRRHTFVAEVDIVENNTVRPATATIRGVVRKGWLRGAVVRGTYRRWTTCPTPTPGNVDGATCFRGALHLRRAGP